MEEGEQDKVAGAIKTEKKKKAPKNPTTTLLNSHIPPQVVISVLAGGRAAETMKALLTMSVLWC